MGAATAGCAPEREREMPTVILACPRDLATYSPTRVTSPLSTDAPGTAIWETSAGAPAVSSPTRTERRTASQWRLPP